MGVLFDIYCIPREPFSVEWSTILRQLVGDGLVQPPFWAGHPLRRIATTSYLRSPELASLQARAGGDPDAARELASPAEALAHVARAESAMLAVEVPVFAIDTEKTNDV